MGERFGHMHSCQAWHGRFPSPSKHTMTMVNSGAAVVRRPERERGRGAGEGDVKTCPKVEQNERERERGRNYLVACNHALAWPALLLPMPR
jgi:hypothetical protein